MKPKHIHFIGICGVAMSALAIAFQKAGYTITGSDAGFFPPVSDNLRKNNINFYPGWHPEKMIKTGVPNLVIVGNVASSTNPEWKYVQQNNLEYLSYPEAIAKFFVKPNSIVCAGTYGKTTTATLLSWILKQANFNPSYMFGGLTVDESFDSASLTTNNTPLTPLIRGEHDATILSNKKGSSAKKPECVWSVLEGDEYKSSRWDNSPKFIHYSPTHLLLTAIKWDHADIYPTKDSYFNVFKKLVKSIPKNGLTVLNENIADDIVALSHCPIIKYGKSAENDYQYLNVKQDKNGIDFKINHNSTVFHISSSFLGEYMAENITGCFALAHKIGVEPEIIIKAISKFSGIKRRLEKRYTKTVTIFDDIAHSPTKAKSTLKTLRSIYPTNKIFAIFEPNTGNRKPASLAGYNNSFQNADEVLIPRLTKVKIDPNDNDQPIAGQKLAEVIKQTNAKTQYFAKDENLINYLKEKTQSNDVIVFLGSHGFRGMIDKLML